MPFTKTRIGSCLDLATVYFKTLGPSGRSSAPDILSGLYVWMNMKSRGLHHRNLSQYEVRARLGKKNKAIVASREPAPTEVGHNYVVQQAAAEPILPAAVTFMGPQVSLTIMPTNLRPTRKLRPKMNSVSTPGLRSQVT